MIIYYKQQHTTNKSEGFQIFNILKDSLQIIMSKN